MKRKRLEIEFVEHGRGWFECEGIFSRDTINLNREGKSDTTILRTTGYGDTPLKALEHFVSSLSAVAIDQYLETK